MSENDNNVLHRIDGKNCFLKVKQALDIGKMCLSFVKYGDDNKMTGSIDCYMDAEEFGALFMKNIENRSLLKKIYNEKQRAVKAGEQYPKSVYTSPMGGKETEDEGAISRSFNIAPGAKSDIVFTALEYPAQKSETGAFIPVKGAKPSEKIFVGGSYDDLILMQYKWSFLEEDYMKRKYTHNRMRSTYNQTHNQNTSKNNEKPSEATTSQNDNKAENTQVISYQNASAKYELIKKGELEKKENGWCSLNIVDKAGQEKLIAFGPKAIEKQKEKWKLFENFIKTNDRFTVTAKEKDGLLYFVSF